MSNVKNHLAEIEHHTINIRHLIIDYYFTNSDFFSLDDIRTLVNTQLTLILSHVEELKEIERLTDPSLKTSGVNHVNQIRTL